MQAHQTQSQHLVASTARQRKTDQTDLTFYGRPSLQRHSSLRSISSEMSLSPLSPVGSPMSPSSASRVIHTSKADMRFSRTRHDSPLFRSNTYQNSPSATTNQSAAITAVQTRSRSSSIGMLPPLISRSPKHAILAGRKGSLKLSTNKLHPAVGTNQEILLQDSTLCDDSKISEVGNDHDSPLSLTNAEISTRFGGGVIRSRGRPVPSRRSQESYNWHDDSPKSGIHVQSMSLPSMNMRVTHTRDRSLNEGKLSRAIRTKSKSVDDYEFSFHQSLPPKPFSLLLHERAVLEQSRQPQHWKEKTVSPADQDDGDNDSDVDLHDLVLSDQASFEIVENDEVSKASIVASTPISQIDGTISVQSSGIRSVMQGHRKLSVQRNHEWYMLNPERERDQEQDQDNLS